MSTCFFVACGNLQSLLLRLNLILFHRIFTDFSVVHTSLKHMIYKCKNHVDSNAENFQNVCLIYTEYVYIDTLHLHFCFYVLYIKN